MVSFQSSLTQANAYFYPNYIDPTAGDHVDSVYILRDASNDYVESGHSSWGFAGYTGNNFFVAHERPGYTSGQVLNYHGTCYVGNWYNFQVVSENGSRLWDAGKNNTVLEKQPMNWSTSSPVVSAERNTDFDGNHASFTTLQYRLAGQNWQAWDLGSSWFFNGDPGYYWTVTDTSKWHTDSY